MAEVYWRSAMPAARPHPAEIPTGLVDVAVVGAGFAGLSIALDLLEAQPGMRVALLDARHAGYGTSGRNAGAVLPLAVLPWLLPGSAGGHDPGAMQRLLHTRIGARIRALEQQHPAGEIRSKRMLLIASNRLIAAGLGWVADAAGSAGIVVERWSGDAATAACGAPARAALSLAAWTIQPAALAASLAERFVAMGGTLLEHTPVSAIFPEGDRVAVKLGSGRRLHAGRVVICTGAYTGALTVPDPPRARAVHTYMRASEPLPTGVADAFGGERLFLSAPGRGMPYWRVHAGRLLFGGTDIGGLPPGAAADALPRAHRAVDRLLRRRLPAAAGHPPAYRWGGAMHVTPTEVPQLARSAVSERIVYAVGFAGSGVALTLSAGPLVRDLILGPASADPEAVALRQALHATTIPWRALLGIVRPATAHLLRGLAPARP